MESLFPAWLSAGAAVVNLVVVIVLTTITAAYAKSTAAMTKAAEANLAVTRTSAHGVVYTWAADLLSDPIALERRRRLFVKLPSFRGSVFELQAREPQLFEAFEDVCRRYDLIGIAGHNNMLPHGIVAKEWGNSIITAHELCNDYLVEYRQHRGKWFWNNFTELYLEAKIVWPAR